ncbi:TIGR03086 family metal-binding protein [Streptomyces sp. NPDC056178]|uniref:TIGR03086 family metal-binding protein n=1 Tax=Streptomyces sp. NPDC056178 TaxID=3345735 RepID=UPI0035E33720
MSEVDLLSGVLSKTGDIIEGVGADQLSLPTPCDDYDVEALIHHVVGWLLVFEAGAQGRSNDTDAANHRCGADPAREFRTAAAGVVAGWEKYGFDRQVTALSGSMPGETVFNMTVMEYLTHGWDLAVATGQPIPYTDQEAAEVLARAKATLQPQYRGENMPFGPVHPVGEDASAVDRLVAFLGRRPFAAP